MPLANRVAPDGTLFATPARGLFLGNRGGRFHDPVTRTTGGRIHASRQWLICLTTFKGRTRDQMGGVWGRGYTELFFLDEVTALSAGHRPCMECRRADAVVFRRALSAGMHLPALPACPRMDDILDAERRDGRLKRMRHLPAAPLPEGAMIRADDGSFLALKGDSALLWTPDGYTDRRPRPAGDVAVLTPPATLAALRQGYRPHWHPSAAASR